MSTPLILYDYEFSPYAQKIRLLLTASSIPFTRCDQPPVLPRPDLESLGITYRRIPVLARGRDVYCDTAAIVDVVQKELGGLRGTGADKAFEAFGAGVFWACLACVPGAMLTEGFVRDRRTIFPLLSRPDLPQLRPSALAEFRATLSIIEHDFLSPGPYIGGASRLGLADVHVAWVVRWILRDLGVEKERGFGREDWPRVHAWLASLPKESAPTISGAEAAKTILGSEYAKALTTASAANDPLCLQQGAAVAVESTDSQPGSHPQHGKLAGLCLDEIVIQLDNKSGAEGVRLHFPRRGYVVKPQGQGQGQGQGGNMGNAGNAGGGRL